MHTGPRVAWRAIAGGRGSNKHISRASLWVLKMAPTIINVHYQIGHLSKSRISTPARNLTGSILIT